MAVEHYVSPRGYGRHWTLVVRGQHRVRILSRQSMTPMWPHVYAGADENCNRSWSLHLWPLFGVHVWWEWPWRPDGSGYCQKCIDEFKEDA